VQCDESKPRCSSCARRDDECEYLVPSQRQRHRLPGRSVMAFPVPTGGPLPSTRRIEDVVNPRTIRSGPALGAKELLNLRLLHHYTVHTAPSIAQTLRLNEHASDLLRTGLPNLAFNHVFLLDAILFVAMIHLRSADSRVSGDYLPIALYRDAALRSLRQAVGAMSPQTAQAVKAASLQLGTVSLAADRVMGHQGLWTANWLALAVGAQNFLAPPEPAGFRNVFGGRESPALAISHLDDVPLSYPTPVGLESLLAIPEDDPDWIHRHDLSDAVAGIASIIGSLARSPQEVYIECMILSWAFRLVSRRFVNLVQKSNPRALIILAHYLILLKFMPSVWLFEGVAEYDMRIIESTVAAEWQRYLDVPQAALRLGDQASLANFLLSQLPGDTKAEHEPPRSLLKEGSFLTTA